MRFLIGVPHSTGVVHAKARPTARSLLRLGIFNLLNNVTSSCLAAIHYEVGSYEQESMNKHAHRRTAEPAFSMQKTAYEQMTSPTS